MTWPPKKCWYCGGKNMVPVQTWYQCQDCKATDTPPVKLGALPVGDNPTDYDAGSKRGRRSSYRPSAAAQKEAAEAREAKA